MIFLYCSRTEHMQRPLSLHWRDNYIGVINCHGILFIYLQKARSSGAVFPTSDSLGAHNKHAGKPAAYTGHDSGHVCGS